MSTDKKIAELEAKIKDLEFKTDVLESLVIAKVPEWAREPLEIVKEKKEPPYPYLKPGTFGSYDYYRIIALLTRNNII